MAMIPFDKKTTVGLERKTKAELVSLVHHLEQEVINWREGTRESVASEDLNRYLRWEAEMKEGQAKAAEKAALDWVAAVYWTLCTPAGPLEVLRLKKLLDDAEDKLEVALRENGRLQREVWAAQVDGEDDY